MLGHFLERRVVVFGILGMELHSRSLTDPQRIGSTGTPDYINLTEVVCFGLREVENHWKEVMESMRWFKALSHRWVFQTHGT